MRGIFWGLRGVRFSPVMKITSVTIATSKFFNNSPLIIKMYQLITARTGSSMAILYFWQNTIVETW